MAESRLGSKVRALRRRNGLTQAKLAENLGISTSYLNLIENNRRPLSASVLIKIAQLFQVDLQTFSSDEEGELLSQLMEVFGDEEEEFAIEMTNPNADWQQYNGHAPAQIVQWRRHFSVEYNLEYYENTLTGETTWEAPKDGNMVA